MSKTSSNTALATAENKPLNIAGLSIGKAQAMKEPNSMLLFGRPKAGKTTFAASMVEVPGYERGLIIDCEMGATAIATNYPTVDVVTIPQGDVTAFNNVINALRDDTDGIGSFYDWVCVDTMSTIARWGAKKLIASMPRNTIGAWGLVNDWIMQTMWDLQYMKPFGISNFHIRTDQEPLTSAIWTTPNVQGGARNTVGNVPDLIGYIYIVNEGNERVHVVDFSPDESRTGGNRFPEIPRVPMGGAKMRNIFDFIRGDKTLDDIDPDTAPRTAAEKVAARSAEAIDQEKMTEEFERQYGDNDTPAD